MEPTQVTSQLRNWTDDQISFVSNYIIMTSYSFCFNQRDWGNLWLKSFNLQSADDVL